MGELKWEKYFGPLCSCGAPAKPRKGACESGGKSHAISALHSSLETYLEEAGTLHEFVLRNLRRSAQCYQGFKRHYWLGLPDCWWIGFMEVQSSKSYSPVVHRGWVDSCRRRGTWSPIPAQVTSGLRITCKWNSTYHHFPRQSVYHQVDRQRALERTNKTRCHPLPPYRRSGQTRTAQDHLLVYWSDASRYTHQATSSLSPLPTQSCTFGTSHIAPDASSRRRGITTTELTSNSHHFDTR